MPEGRLGLPRGGAVGRELAVGSSGADVGRGSGSELDPWSAAWLEHGASYRARQNAAIEADDELCRREVLFCLLGGHAVSYELARSAAAVLYERGIFGDCPRKGDRLQRYIQDLLGRAWYEPRRADGKGRRYRYPKRKAELLRRADDWFALAAPGGLLRRLQRIDGDYARREWLCGCPGIGPKTASWLLRNLGFGADVAILDVHILRALEQSGRLGAYRLPRDYDQIEGVFLRWAEEVGAPAAAFDLLLWELGRGEL